MSRAQRKVFHKFRFPAYTCVTPCIGIAPLTSGNLKPCINVGYPQVDTSTARFDCHRPKHDAHIRRLSSEDWLWRKSTSFYIMQSICTHLETRMTAMEKSHNNQYTSYEFHTCIVQGYSDFISQSFTSWQTKDHRISKSQYNFCGCLHLRQVTSHTSKPHQFL